MGGAFVRRPAPQAAGSGRRWRRMRPLMRIGADIAVRTTALLGSFLVASAVLARVGAPSLAAHQIAFQLFVFLALVLDAIAIAAQIMVGRMLGGGDAAGARAASRRMIGWSLVAGVAFGVDPAGARATSSRAPSRRIRRCSSAPRRVWPLFAAMMPANAVVFALDGILIGAGDTRYLMWSMLAAAGRLRAGGAALARGGLGDRRRLVRAGRPDRGAARHLGVRFAGSRWALTGASA